MMGDLIIWKCADCGEGLDRSNIIQGHSAENKRLGQRVASCKCGHFSQVYLKPDLIL